jgi:ABC-type tungstate transport system permease subunit
MILYLYPSYMFHVDIWDMADNLYPSVMAYNHYNLTLYTYMHMYTHLDGHTIHDRYSYLQYYNMTKLSIIVNVILNIL